MVAVRLPDAAARLRIPSNVAVVNCVNIEGFTTVAPTTSGVTPVVDVFTDELRISMYCAETDPVDPCEPAPPAEPAAPCEP